MLLGFFRKVLFVEHYKRHIWSTRCWNEGGSLTVRASRNCTWHQVSAARHPDTHKDMIWVCAVAAGLFEFVLLWIFCCEVGSVVLTHLLCIGAVHNLVQVSCYGSCSGSHHEVKTLWGPAMVHQSPVCRLTPHLFLESHMVWLDLAEDDGHDWFMVQMVMTTHYWQSTQSALPILRRWALAHVGVLRATDFPVWEPDILGVGSWDSHIFPEWEWSWWWFWVVQAAMWS